MKPLVLISSLAPGGAERITVSFLRYLQKHGEAVPLCTVTDRHDSPLAEELEAAGIVRFDLGASRLADPLALVRLLALVHREGFDIVHAHGQDAAVLAHWARRLGRFRLVITRHVMEEPMVDRRRRRRARAAGAAIRDADAVVTVSRAIAERLTELSGRPREAIRVIFNGIELERFAGAEPGARKRMRKSLGAGPDEPLVLVPAALRDGKGHEVLLRALPDLRRRVPAVRVLIAGAGEREAVLREEARAAGNAVEFLGLRTDIPELMGACDLVVLPSATRSDGTVEEALPTVLIEAAAAGRAVVATRLSGTPEIVVDERTGLLVAPGDSASLADAIATLLLDNARARAYGAAARHIARERFAIETQVFRTLALWRHVLGEDGS
jgi:glycosyltransferase involved in cell wall biosynthesis